MQCRKQHIFLKNQKWEKMKNVQLLLRQLQTSDHRFRAISALISATSPEKWIGMFKLRATSGTTNIHQQSSPLSYHKCREIHKLFLNSIIVYLHHFQDSLRCLLCRSRKYKRFTFVHPVGSIQYVPHLLHL